MKVSCNSSLSPRQYIRRLSAMEILYKLGKVIYESKIAKSFIELVEEAIENEVDLPGSNIYGANLNGANLMWANLCGVDLSGAELSACDLYGAFMDMHAVLRTNFRSVNLQSTMLTNTLLQLSLPV
jgi:hypothetical protein